VHSFLRSLRIASACATSKLFASTSSKLYHLGIRGNISRSALADANETRDWRIY
jgi:hypothetical protein